MPKSSDNVSIGREPRQNPVFMFLPGLGRGSSTPASAGGSGGQGSSRSVLSVPGPTSTTEVDPGPVLQRNTVIPRRPLASSSATSASSSVSPKRRQARPPPRTFRLPSPTKDEERGAGAGFSGDKPTSNSASPSTSSSSPFGSQTTSNSSSAYSYTGEFQLPRHEAAQLGSIRYITQHDLIDCHGVPCIGRALGREELEKYIHWMRKEAPTLFWTGLKESLTRFRKLDKAQVKGWQRILLVHEPAINTAAKFMGRLRNRVQPFDYVAIEGSVSKEEDANKLAKDIHIPPPVATGPVPDTPPRFGEPPRRVVIYALDFLKRLMSGIILASDKQKFISDSDLDEIFQYFYYFGLRAVVGQHMIVLANKTGAGNVHNNTSSKPPVLGTRQGTDYNNKSTANNMKQLSCEWCEEIPCRCSVVSEGFQNANVALHALGLMDEIAGPRLFSVIKSEMRRKIKDVGTDKVDASNIDDLKEWLNDSARAWYTALYTRDNLGRLVTNPSSEFGQELTTMLLEQYGMALINDLFAVIIEFPESKPLLDDLRTCMKAVNLRNILVSNLKSSLERRLLNAGVNTTEVLEAYIATVRALKYVDPTGILVQLVTPPVRDYLKKREETVRVILISLTEESGELSEELLRNPTNPDKTCKLSLKNYESWNPDPIDVPKDKNNLRKSDLIEAMVSIYGSKTVFIDEYRALLADRLLRMPKPGSITREIKCLELLKLRFGEADLQKCEVMLKDVSDSQRLNTRFYEEDGAVLANEAMQVSALIVSAQFWPSLKQEDIQLPGPVGAALDKYTKAFEMIKGNRTLEWQKHIGTVKLEIEHGGTIANFSVSPIQATIIWHFQEKEKWSLDELSKVIGVSTSHLSNRIGFWVSKGMIIHVGQGNYILADAIHESSKATGVIPNKYVEEGETDSPMASTSSQRATELQVFWSYIEAMLTNLETLPLARIHSMLKLFATVECSLEDLQGFLDEKVSQNLLVYSAGQYQLPK